MHMYRDITDKINESVGEYLMRKCIQMCFKIIYKKSYFDFFVHKRTNKHAQANNIERAISKQGPPGEL